MSTAAVSVNFINQQSPGYFHQRGVDLQQLRQDVQSGNLSAAQQDFTTLQTLAQTGPFPKGNVFEVSQRQQDFAAIGQALQAGDLNGAQQALSQLWNTFPVHRYEPSAAATTSSATSSTAAGPGAAGPEIILNLGNAPAGEQITIGLNGASANGGEQVTVSVANPQNPNPEQITFNLAQNSNEQIVLNLFNSNSSSAQSSSAPAQGSGLSVSA